MLALRIKPGESFVIGDATITIAKGNRVLIDAPRHVRVIRCSVLEREKNGKEKARISDQSGCETEAAPNRQKRKRYS